MDHQVVVCTKADEKLMSELQLDDLLRFLRTGAGNHCTDLEEDDWFNVCSF